MTQSRTTPILDFSPFYSSDNELKAKLIQQIRQCCLNNGFFQIIGHGISPELQDRTMSWAKRFFDLPLEEKKKIDRSHSPFNRGYECMRSHMSEPGSSPDLKEGIFIGPEIPEDHPSCVQRRLNCGPNQWPDALVGLEEFQRTSMEYYDAVFKLGKDILSILALTMNYEESFFTPLTDGAVAMLRYIHYPPQPISHGHEGKGSGAHRDYSCITLLMQDNVGGLQVLDETTHEWFDVEPTPGAYVVNLGNIIARLTNDSYKSALHRVINKSGRERYSIPFFFTGNLDYVCECLPRFQEENQLVKFGTATVEEVVRSAVRGTVERAKDYNAKNST